MAENAHLHFVQSTEPLQGGGLGRAAVDLHLAFLGHGVRSQLVTTIGKAVAGSGDENGICTYARRGPERAFYAPEMRRAAGQLVAGADFVHAHGFYVAPNWMLGREARRQGKPLVCHPHGFFEPWILQRSRLRKRIVHLLFENANFNAARLWRALTGKEADQIRLQGIRAPIVVAANGVHLEAFDLTTPSVEASRFATEKRRPRMLFLARLHPKKGLDLLIPAWARMGASRGDWELVVAGPDELNHRADVEKWVRLHQLEDCVQFVGTVSGADKLALLRSADAFVLPSHSEGFSVAILEAMACRVPVLATHACNFPELGSEGGGWLCEATRESLETSLRSVLSASSAELASRGVRARELVEKRFTWPIIAERILDACRQHCQ